MKCTRAMLDAAYDRMRVLSARRDLSTREKLEEGINAALAQMVEPPREALYVESRVVP